MYTYGYEDGRKGDLLTYNLLKYILVLPCLLCSETTGNYSRAGPPVFLSLLAARTSPGQVRRLPALGTAGGRWPQSQPEVWARAVWRPGRLPLLGVPRSVSGQSRVAPSPLRATRASRVGSESCNGPGRPAQGGSARPG
jgi:hypothetical protein